ncbi:MAG: methylenetetrahydrofolate--tRNA-(uracil(54)-C(5))-methyltransferase (FADH(2)-oxidizing) TrmFO [Lentisphaeria bacterium]|jgi:methylenetetrahydrofolate--tRNA-(uracil-5-)-methyltransferase
MPHSTPPHPVTVTVIGGGLAGSEAAWQLARRGIPVRLFEMRPGHATPAHTTGRLAELVCSNSLGSKLPDRATGVLLAELKQYGSLLAELAERHSVPAGGALAVDRDAFATAVTATLAAHPLVTLVREEVRELPAAAAATPLVLATGPLTSDALAADLAALTGAENLAFFDALAPIVAGESVDLAVAFRASRRDKGEREDGDYLNCPFTQAEYEQFWQALVTAETRPLRDFERTDKRFFEGCLAVEVLAKRGPRALTFGPLRPVGLDDPRTGRWPYAVVQLRQENLAGSLYNLVGFQTNLKQGEQERVFRLIPGLANARFVRYGQMHRNTFLNAPNLLAATLELRRRPGLFVAGQLAGIEGYLGSVGTGWLAGVNAARCRHGLPPLAPPPETMLGALCRYLAHADPAHFQPMKANFGLLPPLPAPPKGKRDRYAAYAARAQAAAATFAAATA